VNRLILTLLSLAAIAAYMNRKTLIDAGARLSSKWTKLHPEVKTRAAQVLAEMETVLKDEPYTLHIFDGWRDIKEQEKYISGGTSFVNNALRSYHPWGLAVDFVFKDANNNWTWQPGEDCAFYDFSCHSGDWYWNKLGEAIERAGFEWGGRWKTFDGPHAQYVGAGRTKDLIAKHGTPDRFKFA